MLRVRVRVRFRFRFRVRVKVIPVGHSLALPGAVLMAEFCF